jgi:hypothetical protein
MLSPAQRLVPTLAAFFLCNTLLNRWPGWRHSQAARRWEDLKAGVVL